MLNLNPQGSSSLDSKLQELIRNIKTSKVEQIKENSISNIHSKISAKLISHERLPVELPPVLMEWINSHQDKTLVLLKALQIIDHYARHNLGIQILRQFEALEYFEGFKQYLVSVRGMEEYEKLVDNIIQSLLPFGSLGEREENASNLGNISLENTSLSGRYAQERKESQEEGMKETRSPQKSHPKVLTSSLLPKTHLEHFEFVIGPHDTQQTTQKALFDLSVQLRYGNLDVKYQTLRAIQDILMENPCAHFRNKTELVKELEECVLKKVFQMEAVRILVMIFQGLLQSSASHKESLKSNSKARSNHIQFPLKPLYLQTPLMQPLLSLISSNFSQDWIPWLLSLHHPWTFPYIFKIINQLPHSTIQSPTIQQLLRTILSTTSITHQSLPLQNNSIDLSKFQFFRMRESYSHIQQFLEDLFDLEVNADRFGEVMEKLGKGVEGLGYDPRVVEVYVDVAMYSWYRHRERLELGEYYDRAIGYLLEISSHTSQPVRLRLYEVLLEKVYTEQVDYYNTSQSPSTLILSLLSSSPTILPRLIQNSIDQKDTCLIYLLQILKQLYTHHQKPTHQTIKLISPLLSLFSTSQPSKISNLSKHLLSRLNKKQLLTCEAMNLFSKQRKVRISASSQLLNYKGDISQLFQVTNTTKKPFKIDQECILNYIINVGSKDLKVSIRVSALVELIESVRRAELTPLVKSRLVSLNESLVREVVEMVNQDADQEVWIGGIMTLCLELYLKSVVGVKQLPPLQLLILMMKAYANGGYKELLNSLIGLVYSICFRDPFGGKASIHWYYINSGEFIKLIHLEMKERNACKIKEVLGGQSKGSTNDEIPKITTPEKYLSYVYSKLEGPQTFQLKFQQVQQLIAQAYLSPTPAYSFCLIKTLFLTYNDNRSKFKKLSQDFQHLLPPLINYLNRETTKHLEDDILTIIKSIGIKTQKQCQSLINNKKIQLRVLDIPRSISKETVEGIIRVLPEEPQALSNVLKPLLQKDCFKDITSQLGLISLSSTLHKGIRSRNKRLKLYSLQALFSLLSPDFILKNTTFISLIIDQLSDPTLTPLCTHQCLRILKQTLTLCPHQSFIQTIQHSNLISTSIQWLSSPKLTLVKISCLQLLNSIASTSLVESYDLTITYIDQVNAHFEKEGNNPEDLILQLMLVYEGVSGVLLLSKHIEKEQFISYLLSTELLYYVLKNITGIETVVLPKLKHNYYLSKVLDVIGSLLLFLLQSEDLFIMHLNKLTTGNQKIIYTFSSLIEYSGEEYSFIIARLINAWNRCHKHLNQTHLGADVLNNLLSVTNNNQVIKGLIAVSENAKIEYINKGYYLKYLQSALMTIDEVIVNYLSSQNKSKKKPTSSISVSRTLSSPKDINDLHQILQFLKSFYHPTPDSDSPSLKLTISNQLSSLSVDLLSKLQECCNIYPQILPEFRKVICNLSSSGSHFHKVMIELIDPKHSLVKDLIGKCGKEEIQSVEESLELLGILGRQPEIRTLIFRNKLISELNSKILKNWEQRKDIEQPMIIILSFYLHLSCHQDAQQKLITDKKLLDLLLIQLQTTINNHQSQLPLLILKLLCNLSYSKHNKPLLISNKDFHKTLLTLITSENVDERLKVYLGECLYNLLYKSAEAIGVYKKQRVLEELRMAGVGKGKEMRQVMEKVMKVLNTEFK